jgi:stearoyl-CoA desaturase (delta-9 desaturase)
VTADVMPSVDLDVTVPVEGESPSGTTGARRGPALYDKILTALFAIAPFVALAALIAWDQPFPWFAVVLTAVLIVVLGHGITIGFHRLFTHRGFVAARPLKLTLAVLGTLAFQGSIIGWVADHRRHHRFSDRPGDPHSPYWKGDEPLSGIGGLWHAHLGWTFSVDPTSREKYAPDLLADRDIVLVDRLFLPIAVMTFAIPFALGFLWNGWAGAVTCFLCAGLVRVGITLNGTWAVNSICHRFGTRPFDTRDRSTNFAPLAIITMGEAWHNNHHAFPRSARHGLLPGQVDTSARIIRWLERRGWATDVQWPDPVAVEARREKEVRAMGSESFQKREREKRRQERNAERRERRQQRKEEVAEPIDTDALMERFRVLSEQHASRAIDDATYEAERLEIFTALGLEDAHRV